MKGKSRTVLIESESFILMHLKTVKKNGLPKTVGIIPTKARVYLNWIEHLNMRV